MHKLSEHATFSPLAFANDVAGEHGMISVRNTNVETAWVSMQNYGRVMAYVEVSATWNASDTLITAKLQQATSAAGAGAKDLTTVGSGITYNYDSATPINAENEFIIFEARAEDLDVNNGFKFVRLYLATTSNTGTDNVCGMLIRYEYHYPRYGLQGTPASGSKMYVSPHSRGGY